MHAVVRSYSGTGAKELFDLLVQRKADVEALIRGVTGFVAYTLVQTADGGISVTVCQDKAGADESLQRAREWIQANAVRNRRWRPDGIRGLRHSSTELTGP